MKERQSEPELARTDIDDRQQGQQPERDGLLSLCHLRHHAPSSGFVPVLPHARKDSVLEVGTRAAWTAEYATGAGTNEEHALSDRLASLRTALRLTPESTRWLGEYAAGYRGARAIYRRPSPEQSLAITRTAQQGSGRQVLGRRRQPQSL